MPQREPLKERMAMAAGESTARTRSEGGGKHGLWLRHSRRARRSAERACETRQRLSFPPLSIADVSAAVSNPHPITWVTEIQPEEWRSL